MINSKCRPECFSYRDPAGGAIRVGDAFFRRITASGWEDWRRFNDSGLAKDLVADGWLLPFGDAEKQPSGEWLAPVETLDFVSYSYEWAFGQLRDAAVLEWQPGLVTLSFLQGGAGRTVRRVAVDQLDSLRILGDSSSLEIFLNDGQQVLSTRYYPQPQAQGIAITGAQARVWEMGAMQVTQAEL